MEGSLWFFEQFKKNGSGSLLNSFFFFFLAVSIGEVPVQL